MIRNCGCNFGVKVFGCSNPANIILDGNKPETLNWSEISVPEILYIPEEKPDIENIEQVHVTAEITNLKLVETPYYFKSIVYNLAKLDDNGNPFTLPNGDYAISQTDVVFYLPPLRALSNEEGSCLTGRKLIVEGKLAQKIVYTADVSVQSVHSVDYEIPFSSFILPYTKVEEPPKKYIVIDQNNPKCIVTIIAYKYDELIIDLYEEFCVDAYVEDVYITPLDCRTIFKNVTLFLRAKPFLQCK